MLLRNVRTKFVTTQKNIVFVIHALKTSENHSLFVVKFHFILTNVMLNLSFGYVFFPEEDSGIRCSSTVIHACKGTAGTEIFFRFRQVPFYRGT
jgi:hypothetical protein